MAGSPPTYEFVEHPTEHLAKEAADVFAGVMQEDPVAICLAGGKEELIHELGHKMLRALLLTPDVSHIFTARNETGELVGFTVFSLPGQLMLSTEEQRENAKLNEFMSKLSPEGQEFYATTMKTGLPAAHERAFGITDAESNTYWCNFAMVRREYQNKGVAKKLFQLAFHEADKMNAPVALTTTNEVNVPIYQKIGFHYYSDKDEHFPYPWGSLPPWSLWFFMRAPHGAELTPPANT